MTSTITKPRQTEQPTKAAGSHRLWWQKAPAKLFQGTLALVCFTAALEGFFAFAGVGEQEILQPDTVLGCRHIPGKLVTWRLEGYSRDRFSKAGLRDVEHTVVKPAGIVRIALLGDSATEALQVPLEETYSRMLQKQLGKGFEVINFGCSSYSTGQELIYYQNEIAQYKPDYVIVLYSRGDSIENVVDPLKRGAAEPRPYGYLDQNGQLQIDNSVLELGKAKLAPSPLMDYLRANSRIYGVFSQTNLSLVLNEKLYWKLRGWANSVVSLVAGKPHSGNVDMPVYDAQDKLKVTSAIIDRLASDVSANNGKLVLLMFPDIGNGDFEYTAQVKHFREHTADGKYELLDLTKDFKDYGNLKPLFLQFHFSKIGHALTAKKLYDYLKKPGSSSN